MVHCPSVHLSQHGPWAANPLLHFCCWWAGDIDQFLWQRWTNASSASLSAYVGSWTDLFFLQCCFAVLYGSTACTDNPTKFLSNLQNVPLFIMLLPCYRSAPMSFSSFLFVKAANFKVGVHALRGFQFHCWLSLCDLMEMCRKCEKYRHSFLLRSLHFWRPPHVCHRELGDSSVCICVSPQSWFCQPVSAGPPSPLPTPVP